MPTDMKAYMKARYHQRMAELIKIKGGRCARCGTTVQLEFDHVDPGTKLFTIAGRAASAPWAVLLAEIEKCQLLCRPHHEEKTKAERPMPEHGTEWRYRKYGCRCAVCSEGYAQIRRGYPSRQRRRPATVPS